MSKARVELYYDGIGTVMRSSQVRAGLLGRARRVRSAASSVNSSEGGSSDYSVSHGTRPKGRPYARVTGSRADEEFGDSKTKRRRVLARAATGG